MHYAKPIPAIPSEQIVQWKKLDDLCEEINFIEECRLPPRVFRPCIMTAATVQIIKLYGYKVVEDQTIGTLITW